MPELADEPVAFHRVSGNFADDKTRPCRYLLRTGSVVQHQGVRRDPTTAPHDIPEFG
jgi:hypothetical protein